MAGLPDEAEVLDALTFTWTDEQDRRWETEPRLEFKTPMQLKFVGNVRRDGNVVGVVSRQVRRGTHGPEIQHVRIELEADARGQGFASAYWRACLQSYARVGIVRITFTADEDGRRFWARDPVRFTDPETPRHLLEQYGGLEALTSAGFDGDEASQFVSEIQRAPDTFTPATLNASSMGQAILVGAGAGWGAAVDIAPVRDEA